MGGEIINTPHWHLVLCLKDGLRDYWYSGWIDCSKYIDTKSMGLPIVHFKGLQVEFSEIVCISVPCLSLF